MKAPGQSMVRALLFSGVALALAVAAFLRFDRHQESEKAAQQEAQQERLFSALCEDVTRYKTLRFNEQNSRVVLTKKDRWRLPSSRPIEDRELMVRLAHLRGLIIEELTQVDDLAGLGLREPAQRLELIGGQATCVLSLGLKHPSEARYALMRQSGTTRRIGWASLKPQGDGLIALESLRVRSPLPLSEGQIDGLEFRPQVGAEPFAIKRQRNQFKLLTSAGEQRADEIQTKALLTRLTGLRGEWVETPPRLQDADLSLLITHPPGKSQADFFLADARVYLRVGSSVFLLDDNPLDALMPKAESLRDLQVIRYDRNALMQLVLHDGTGRVFTYRRQVEKKGVDRWFDGERLIHEGHRLAAMQWDLHTLRALAIVDEIEDLNCAKHCRRVVASNRDGEPLVDLRIERHEGAHLVRLGSGPVMRVPAQPIDRWPFAAIE